MDQQQVKEPAELLTWLDEQQREDRRQLAALQTLAKSQSQELEAVTKRFEDLERRLTGTQAQLTKFTELEGALQALKNEVLSALEESKTKLRAQDTQLASQIDAQRPQIANLAKVLESVQTTLTSLETEVEQLPARIDSQTEQAAGLARDIEELEKRFNQTQARIVQLNERLSNHTDSMTELATRLERLEGRLSNTQAQLVKFPQIEAALQEAKREIVLMIKGIEEQRKKETRETAKIRDAEHKETRTALDLLDRRLEAIPPLQERLKTLVTEDERLQKLITEHAQRIPPLREFIEDHKERISYLEEARPRTSGRIDELEVKIPPLYEGIDKNAGKIEFLEEWAQRSAEKIDELSRFEDHLDKWRAGFIEEIQRGEQRRDRRLTDWVKRVEEHEEMMEEWQEVLHRYEIVYQDHRRVIGELQTLAQQLERDQAEVAEQQRLADERLQRELVAWQEENEKRWHLFLKQRDYDWEQVHKHDEEQDGRLESLEAWRPEIVEHVATQLDRLDENDRNVLTRIVSLIRQLDDDIERQIKRRSEQREALSKEIEASDVLVGRDPGERRPRLTSHQLRDKRPKE